MHDFVKKNHNFNLGKLCNKTIDFIFISEVIVVISILCIHEKIAMIQRNQLTAEKMIQHNRTAQEV